MGAAAMTCTMRTDERRVQVRDGLLAQVLKDCICTEGLGINGRSSNSLPRAHR